MGRYDQTSSFDKYDTIILRTVARPYGMYDNVYHILAHICISSNSTNSPIFNPVAIGIKQTTIDTHKAIKYVTVVTYRFSSNINRNWRVGPDKNILDAIDTIFPLVYKNTNGAGLPRISLTNKRKDRNVIRYPVVKQIMNPYILYIYNTHTNHDFGVVVVVVVVVVWH